MKYALETTVTSKILKKKNKKTKDDPFILFCFEYALFSMYFPWNPYRIHLPYVKH